MADMEPMEPSPTMGTTPTIACACRSRPFMTVEAAASVLGISEDYLHVGIREGRIPAHRFGRAYRVRRDFINSFVATPSGTRFEDFAAQWMARELSEVAS